MIFHENSNEVHLGSCLNIVTHFEIGLVFDAAIAKVLAFLLGCKAFYTVCEIVLYGDELLTLSLRGVGNLVYGENFLNSIKYNTFV